MNYIISFVEVVSNKHPEAAIVCGGDVNRLDMQEFKSLSGWDLMVDFPTWGNECLDNCLTNRVDRSVKHIPYTCLLRQTMKALFYRRD